MEGYEASTYGDRFADVYDEWYATVGDVEGCVARVCQLVTETGGGAVLELGVGSGRLAIPLAASGLEVHGIDASATMLQRLRAKPGGDAGRATLGDMADLHLDDPPPFAVVLAAFNTLFNLPTAADQQRCLARSASLLSPGGALVVEAFVPGDSTEGSAQAAVEPRHIGVDSVVLTVSQSDPSAQTVSGQHIQLSESGIRLRPWFLRWSTPAQLDAMAAGAGLRLEWRHAGWRKEPFDQASSTHVSCWRRPAARSEQG